MTASTPRWDLVLSLAGADALERTLEDARQDLGAAEIDADDVFSLAAGFGHNRYMSYKVA
jgi:hypothetical protein